MLNFLAFIVNIFFVLIIGCISLEILFAVLYAVFKIVNALKKTYIHIRINHIKKVELYPHRQTYRRDHELTGYSVNRKYNSITEHYRIRTRPNGYSRKVKVTFMNGHTLSAHLKEKSAVYEAIMKQATN